MTMNCSIVVMQRFHIHMTSASMEKISLDLV